MLSAPTFESPEEKALTGICTRMSYAENTTASLWRNFMPRRKKIAGLSNNLLYSVEVYEPGFFNRFNPEAVFEKWAAMESAVSEPLPSGMQRLILPAGLYAVFNYRGPAKDGYKAYQYIYQTWIPQSGYAIDDRPHFAVMGEKYNNVNDESEETLWIPVMKK